jgi:hypothetical protein
MGKVVNNLDIISLLFILTGGIVVLYLSFSAGIGQYGMGLAFLAGAFVYLHIRKSSHRIKSLDIDLGNSKGENTHKTLLILSNTIFFLCFSASIYILHQAIYIRPPIYFILVTVAYLSIFIEIFYININKEGPACYLNILKTILLSLSFRAGRYFSFATIPGTDTQFHLRLANLISELGHIPGYETVPSQYVYTPLWHVLVSSTGILLDADSSKTLFLSIALPFVIITSLFSFLIVKKIAANVQIGLIALLFVNIADMLFIRGLTNINTGSLVHCLFFFILFCLIQEKNNTIFSAFILLSIFSMVLTHQLSTFCVLIIFFSLLVSKHVYNFLLSRFELKDNEVKKLPLNITTTLFTFFLVVLVFYWSTMGEAGHTFFSGMVGRLKGSLLRMFTEYTSACSYTNVFATFDIWSNLLYNLGYSILLGLAVVGLLLWLNRKYISLTRFAYIIAVVSLFAVIYLGTYIGLGHMFIPHRFLAFLEVFLVICAAYSVYVIYRSYTQPRGRIFVCFVVAALIFFMVTTPYINRNDTIYCNEREYREDYTSSEVASAVWAVSHTSNEIIYKDSLFCMYKIPTVADISLSGKDVRKYPSGITTGNKRGLVIVRPYFERMGGTIFYSGTFGKMRAHNSSQFLGTVTKNYDLAFSSGGTRVYQHTDSTTSYI